MPGSFFNSLIYRALGGMARRKTGCFRVRIPRSPPFIDKYAYKTIRYEFINKRPTLIGSSPLRGDAPILIPT
jgi:hypothetical protein